LQKDDSYEIAKKPVAQLIWLRESSEWKIHWPKERKGGRKYFLIMIRKKSFLNILLMEEILHHLGYKTL